MPEPTRIPASPRRRVLHVVGAMNRGGVESWLMSILRSADRSFDMSFLVNTAEKAAFDDEIRALGAPILRCLFRGDPLSYAFRLRALLRAEGPFDVVHSHVHFFSGWVLAVARSAGVPRRIAHSHNDTSRVEGRGVARSLYRLGMQGLIRRNATLGLACSGLAAAALWGERWRSVPNLRILHYGISLVPFQARQEPGDARRSAGLPEGVKVLGHLGRFDEQKNHAFLLRTARRVMEARPATWLLLVGDGPLRQSMQETARRLGIADRTVFAGVRGDVPALLNGAMDVFLFPSFHEGLPLAVLEAQAAGLPILLSDRVSDEVCVVPGLIHRLPIDEEEPWVRTCLAALDGTTRGSDRERALHTLQASDFNIASSIPFIEKVYA
jgi:glycosyltransferase involved in cell wall biosynthesis